MQVEVVALESLHLDPNNARRHDERSISALVASLQKFGQVLPILATSDNVVVAGNGVLLALRRMGKENIRVVRTEMAGPDRDLLALTINRTAELSSWDDSALRRILAQVDAGSFDLSLLEWETPHIAESVMSLDTNEIAAWKDDILSDDPERSSVSVLNPCPIFSATNQWDLPDLREDRLYSGDVLGTWLGEKKYTKPLVCIHSTAKFDSTFAGNILGFYVDDDRFETAWNDAVRFVASMRSIGWAAVIATDFSLWRDDPVAIQIWNVYRNRWCTRYWQECGFQVIPSLCWSSPRSYDFAFAGLPKHIPVAALQVRTTRDELGKRLFVTGLKEALSRLEIDKLVVYGAENNLWATEHLPASSVLIPSWMSRLSKKRK